MPDLLVYLTRKGESDRKDVAWSQIGRFSADPNARELEGGVARLVVVEPPFDLLGDLPGRGHECGDSIFRCV